MRSFNAIIKQVYVFLLFCVCMVSLDANASIDPPKEERYDLFLGIQCQVWSDYGRLEEATYAYWEKNAAAFKDAGVELGSYDVAYVTNTQFDHAIARMITLSNKLDITDVESAVILYSKHCQYL